jgi:hypothetical protein
MGAASYIFVGAHLNLLTEDNFAIFCYMLVCFFHWCGYVCATVLHTIAACDGSIAVTQGTV